MSLALIFLYLMLNMFRMLIHPSSGACDLCVELFRGLHSSGSMCAGAIPQRSVLVLQPAYGYHATTARPQRNSNTHRARSRQPM